MYISMYPIEPSVNDIRVTHQGFPWNPAAPGPSFAAIWAEASKAGVDFYRELPDKLLPA